MVCRRSVSTVAAASRRATEAAVARPDVDPATNDTRIVKLPRESAR